MSVEQTDKGLSYYRQQVFRGQFFPKLKDWSSLAKSFDISTG